MNPNSPKLNAVIHDGGHVSFTLISATQRLSLVRKVTAKAFAELKPLQQQLHNSVPADPRTAALQTDYLRIVSQWKNKMRRLGLAVHGLWQVGFDCEEGWYSWQYPERKIRYFIEYGQTFEQRSLLAARANAALNWALER